MVRLEVLTASLEDPRVVYALVKLHADVETVTHARRPLNLALVIDRSSSMRGPRIVQAACAARQVVEKLGPDDRLAVVLFDSSARVVQPPGVVTPELRTKILGELARVETGAGTNLAAGLKKGCELVASGFVRDAIARVVLLTDGLPSVGICDAEKLGELAEAEAARGVTTTAMGIGENFDDDLLGEISRRGRGGFYYLATPESIPAAFGRELTGVFAIAASGVEVRVLPEPDVTHCEVLHRHVSRALPDGLAIEIGVIAEGAPRQVLLRLTRDPAQPGKLLAKLAVTAHGTAGPHLDRIVAPVPGEVAGSATAEVAAEHLRIAVAAAVDEAWARRASGRRGAAMAALAEVRSAVAGASDRKLAPPGILEGLLHDLDEAERAVAGAARELEKQRRSARERSFVTLMGQSVVRPIPPLRDDRRDDEDD